MREVGSATSRSTPGAEVTSTEASTASARASWFATKSALMLSVPASHRPRPATTSV
jgi:hypothetical protein